MGWPTRWSLVVLGALSFVLACSGDDGGERGVEPPDAFSLPPACDPDGMEACPDDWFVCTEDDAGNKHCEGQVAVAPGEGAWACEVEDGTTLTCVGDQLPPEGGRWECEEHGDEVTCTSDLYEPASSGGDSGEWDCLHEGEFVICELGDYEEPESPPDSPTSDGGIDFCFYDVEDPTGPPLVHGWYSFEVVGGRHVIHIILAFNEAFVDNTYGVNSSPNYDHKFRDLVGSDKAEVGFLDGNGDEVLRAKFDYISESDDATSGYDCLGVTGGDGDMIEGDEAYVVAATSSLDRNLNELGCVFLEDSPVDDECPGWDYRVVYEMWIDAEAFGGAGFGGVIMSEVHASPSRSTNSIPIEPGPCP